MNSGASRQRFLDPDADAMLARREAPRKALFLDRDGVINVDRNYVHTAAATEWVPGIFELVAAAHANGFLPIVVTNQAGIGRGLYDEAQFLAYTQWIHGVFAARGAPLLATYFCPHHPQAGIGAYLRECPCRKPAPGMILAAADAFSIDLAGSMLLGDKPSDIGAAIAAGVGDSALLSEPGRGFPDAVARMQAHRAHG